MCTTVGIIILSKDLNSYAAAYRAKNKKEPERALEIFDHWEVLRLASEDFDWLLADAVQRTEVNDRLLALRLAIESWDGAGRPFSLRWSLRATAKQERTLWDAYRKSGFTDLALPVKRFWYRYVRYTYGSKWWWIQKYRNLRRKWWWLRNQFVFYRKLKFIASGEPVHWLQHLAREADEQNHSHWATKSWSGLERKRGKLVARAARQGCIAVWRKHTPPLPHEKPKPNSTNCEVIVGLSGLQAELGENAKAIASLTEAEASLATRYAMDELNGFPGWLEPVAMKHPVAVQKILDECVQGEWQFQADRENTHEVMARLSWSGGMLCEMSRPKLLMLLEAGSPQNYTILRDALVIFCLSGCFSRAQAEVVARAGGPQALAYC